MSDRVERLLTMLLLEQLGTASQSHKINVLLRVGLKNAEIAKLLGTTPAVVAQTAYASKKEKTKGRVSVRKMVRSKRKA